MLRPIAWIFEEEIFMIFSFHSTTFTSSGIAGEVFRPSREGVRLENLAARPLSPVFNEFLQVDAETLR
jgi:hypothetical protein